MWIFVLLVVVVLCISLFDFFVTRTWHKVTYGEDGQQNEKLRLRHKRANAIRRAYNRVMLLTVGFFVVSITLSLYTQTIIGNMYPPSIAQVPEYDTTQMLLEAPPMEEIETIENNYKLEGNSTREQDAAEERKEVKGEDIQTPENTDPGQKQNAPPGNTGVPEKPGTSTNPPDKTIKIKSGDIQSEYDKSQQQYNEMKARSEQKKREREQRKLEEERKRIEGNNKANVKPPTSKSGTADVDWDKSKRKAFQNNDDNVRTPKYTCPGGVSGKVAVKVKISSTGTIISATPITTATDPCLVEQAVLYARTKSRFEASSREVEELTLTYTFYP